MPLQEAEGEELRWMEEAEVQRNLVTAAVAGPSAGSTGSRRHNSDSHHKQRMDRIRSIERTERCSRLDLHLLLLQAPRFLMGSLTMWPAAQSIHHHIHRRGSTDLHAAHSHRSYAAVGSL